MYLKVPIAIAHIKTTCNDDMSVINAKVSPLFMTIQKTFSYLRKAGNGNKGLNWSVCSEFYSANSKNYPYGQYKVVKVHLYHKLPDSKPKLTGRSTGLEVRHINHVQF